MYVQLLSAAVAANSAPAGASAGVPLRGAKVPTGSDGGTKTTREENECTIVIEGTVNAGQTLAGTFFLWGYVNDLSKWFRFKAINGGALAETGTDTINYGELVTGIRHYDRVYLELVSPSGTGASFNAYLVCRQSPSYG